MSVRRHAVPRGVRPERFFCADGQRSMNFRMTAASRPPSVMAIATGTTTSRSAGSRLPSRRSSWAARSSSRAIAATQHRPARVGSVCAVGDRDPGVGRQQIGCPSRRLSGTTPSWESGLRRLSPGGRSLAKVLAGQADQAFLWSFRSSRKVLPSAASGSSRTVPAPSASSACAEAGHPTKNCQYLWIERSKLRG